MLVLTTLVHVGRLISGSAPCPLEVESKCRHKKWVFEQTDDAPGSRKEKLERLYLCTTLDGCTWEALVHLGGWTFIAFD